MPDRYICIHGHFYQPPRENPWLEEVELQESAHPYHDWNQRIASECYAPNTAARILDSQGKIKDIVNNYSRISFDFGPTLLSWLERHDPETYSGILRSDVESQELFSGHGSALAQCYNHMIMPLSNSRDKLTQVIWGVKDFEYRFNRFPEGIWLPETAVDMETLEHLVNAGIKFTILAPNQAKAVRRIAGNGYYDVSGSRINPRQPYLCRLPSGKSIVVFFYDGPVSQSIAFTKLLDHGQNLLDKLNGLFNSDHCDQLVNISTDGETYGHHHPRGDMALAFVLNEIAKSNFAKSTNYAEFLEKHPPEYEVEIFENSSWSCVHGVERWRNDCGCNSGMHSGWHQRWRRPLREAMDWLREEMATVFVEEGRKYLRDPWACRNEYIDVILDRSRDHVEKFLQRQALRPLSPPQKEIVLKLCEMQRHAMLMYTSCGWFFDEVSGLENIQILRYASRAMQLAESISGKNFELEFLDHLRRVPSNLGEYSHAAQIYEKFVKPSVIDLERVGAHYAVSSLFGEYPKTAQIYSYSAESQEYVRQENGRRKVAVGRTIIRSEITWEERVVEFAAQHWGDHQISGGVRGVSKEIDFIRMRQDVLRFFKPPDPVPFEKVLHRYFPARHYALQHLFKDEQFKVLYQILDATLGDVEAGFRQINEHHNPIIQVVRQLGVPLPRMLMNAVTVMIDTDILRALAADPIDLQKLEALVKEVQECRMEVDKVTLAYIARKRINGLMQAFLKQPRGIRQLQAIERVIATLKPLGLEFEFWTAQNIYFWVGKRIYRHMALKANQGNANARKWLDSFDVLGKHFNINIGIFS